MKRRFLEEMGLEKEKIDQIMAENGKDIEEVKGKLEQTKEELKRSKEQLVERDDQLEELKKSTGDNESLKQQITELQNENQKMKQEKESEIKELKLSAAIKASLGDSAQDPDLVVSLFDRSKLILGDDGKITGLNEQLKSLKETKKFLFREDNSVESKPGFHPIGVPGLDRGQGIKTDAGKVDMKTAIQAKIQAQMAAKQ